MTDLLVEQSPIRYKVTSAPTRIGGMLAPFTILNLSTTGTVWISHNPGLMEELSIPLFAGATMTRQVDGDFFAKCETGDECDIMLIKYVSDWTGAGSSAGAIAIAAAILASGIVIIDDPTRLIFGTLPANASETADISRYQSICLTATFSGGGVGQTLTIAFQDSLGQDVRQIQIVNSHGIARSWRGSMPCYGSDIALLLTPSGTASIVLIGSYRPSDRIVQDVLNSGPDGSATQSSDAFWTESNTTLTTGTSSFYSLPPWFGTIEADIHLVCTAVPGASRVEWQRIPLSAGGQAIYRNDQIVAAPGTNTYNCKTRMTATGDTLRLQITNVSGANFTGMNIRIAPIDGFGI